MAQARNRTRSRRGDDDAARATRRVVLKRERVIVLADGQEPPEGADVVEAWVPVGEFPGATKSQAIQRYAGVPGTPDARIGVYKAPAWSSWKGGEVYEAPPQPLVQRRDLEDE